MANLHNNAAELLKSFVEAGNALEELPKVKEDLALTNQLLTETDAELQRTRDTVTERDQRIADLEAALSAKESALAEATFRSGEAQSKLDHILGIVGGVKALAQDAEGEVQSLTQDLGVGVGVGHPQPSTEVEGQSDEGKPESSSDMTTESSGTPATEADGSPEPKAPSASETDTNFTSEIKPYRSYYGVRWEEKPSDVTWEDFISAGGEAAPWLLAPAVTHYSNG